MSHHATTRAWDSGATGIDLLVLLALADFAGGQDDPYDYAYPAIATLAAKTGLGDRTVQRALRSLEASKAIRRTGEHAWTPRKSTIQYRIEAQSEGCRSDTPSAEGVSDTTSEGCHAGTQPRPLTPSREDEEEARERGQPTATATAAVTAPPGLHPDHGEVVAILEAARAKRPGVVVDEASVNSALMAHRSADAVSAAHEAVSQLSDGTARTDIASTVLRWVLRGQGEQRGGGQRKGGPRRGETSDVASGRGSSSALARAMARDREQAELRRRRAEQAEVGS